jgi:hypothetical protein
MGFLQKGRLPGRFVIASPELEVLLGLTACHDK